MTAAARRWSRAGGAVALIAAATFGLLSGMPWLMPMGTDPASLPRATDAFMPWTAGSAMVGIGLLTARARSWGSVLIFVVILLLATWAITLRAWLLPSGSAEAEKDVDD